MRVSARAEYACMAMVALAENFGARQPLRLKAIADAHEIPQRFLVQILLQLKGLGLVLSVRGALGGYQLARRPERICLAEILNAIDPPALPRADTDGLSASPIAQVVRAVWKQVRDEEQRILAETSLADLVRRTHQSTVASYQI